MTKGVMIRGLMALSVTWGLVFGVTSYARSKRVTSEKVVEVLGIDDFADWSEVDSADQDPKEREARLQYLDGLLKMIQELDLREAGAVFSDQGYGKLVERLSLDELNYLLEPVYGRFKPYIAMFDRLSPQMRENIINRGLRKKSVDDEWVARFQKQHPNFVNEIVLNGVQEFYQEASLEKKASLIHIFVSLQESLQGFGKPDFGGL